MKTRLLLKLTGLSLKGKVMAGVVAASVVGTSAVGTYKYVEYRQEKQARIVTEAQAAKNNVNANKDTAPNSTTPTQADVINVDEVKTDDVKAVDTPTITEPKKEEPTATKPTTGGTVKTETPPAKQQEDTKPKLNAWVYDEALTAQWNSLDNENTYTGVAYNKIYEALRAYAEGKISADAMRVDPSYDDKYLYTNEPYVITRKYWTEPGIGVMIISHYATSPTKVTVSIGSIQSMRSSAKSAGLYTPVSDYDKRTESEMIFRKVVCYKNEATNQVRVARLVASIWFTGAVPEDAIEPGYKFL